MDYYYYSFSFSKFLSIHFVLKEWKTKHVFGGMEMGACCLIDLFCLASSIFDLIITCSFFALYSKFGSTDLYNETKDWLFRHVCFVFALFRLIKSVCCALCMILPVIKWNMINNNEWNNWFSWKYGKNTNEESDTKPKCIKWYENQIAKKKFA